MVLTMRTWRTKALPMSRTRPSASLPGAINYALSTTTDLLEQFVVTKVGKRLCRTRNLFNMGRSICITRFNIFNGGAVSANGYS